MNIDYKTFPVKQILSLIQHYNHEKYWKRRNYVISPPKKYSVSLMCRIYKYYNTMKSLFYLVYIKRCDAYNNASMGTDLNKGAIFISPPKLPHGLNGIIVHHHAIIGSNCKIYQQVTIGDDGKEEGAPHIGDNVIIGTGAKIIGKINIGNNVVIGAGAIVVTDIPNNSIVVGPKASISINKNM